RVVTGLARGRAAALPGEQPAPAVVAVLEVLGQPEERFYGVPALELQAVHRRRVDGTKVRAAARVAAAVEPQARPRRLPRRERARVLQRVRPAAGRGDAGEVVAAPGLVAHDDVVRHRLAVLPAFEAPV